METRPISLMRERAPPRKATRPMMNSTGATAAMLNDRTCTISVVPTLAPSMIASAGTRPTRPSAVKELVISAVAVLLCSSAVRPMPAAKAVKRLLRRLAEQPAQIGTEGAQNPAVDHVQAPQQQRHAAHQVEKNHASHDRPLRELSSNDQAIGKRRRINPFVRRWGRGTRVSSASIAACPRRRAVAAASSISRSAIGPCECRI